jgi:hypothetical protein
MTYLSLQFLLLIFTIHPVLFQNLSSISNIPEILNLYEELYLQGIPWRVMTLEGRGRKH